MKSLLSKYGLGAFLGGGSKRFLAWPSIIGVTLFGGYSVNNHFGFWAVVAVGFAGMFVGGVAYMLQRRKKIYSPSSSVARESVVQISSKWNYRPRDSALRNSTVTPSVAAEPTHASGFSNSELNENTDIWYNFGGQKSDT